MNKHPDASLAVAVKIQEDIWTCDLERLAQIMKSVSPEEWASIQESPFHWRFIERFIERCYEAALAWSWIYESRPVKHPFFRRAVRLRHGHVELWSVGDTGAHGVVSYHPDKGLGTAGELALFDANPAWDADDGCISASSGYNDNQTPIDMGGDDFLAFADRVVRAPRILGIVEVAP